MRLEHLGEIPDDLGLEVSSPGADRILKVPDDINRFKDMPMRVCYAENMESNCPEGDGVFLLDSIEKDTEICVWKLANVKENRDPQRKGRPLSRKQKDWRLRLPFNLHRMGRIIPCDFIGVVKSQQPVYFKGEVVSNHDELMSNFFAQPDALAYGKTPEQLQKKNVPPHLVPHKTFSGNRPSFSLLLPSLNAYNIGQVQEEMRSGQVPLEKYVITKTLTKPPEAYPDAKNQPHILMRNDIVHMAFEIH